MKRISLFLCMIFISVICHADTINLHWLNYDGTTYQYSTCEIDSDLILPSTPPTRYGYTFTGWKLGNYIPIEYLESTGTQYIDTRVYQQNAKNYATKLQYSYTNANSQNSSVCGIMISSGTTNSWGQPFIGSSNTLELWMGRPNRLAVSSGTMNVGTVYSDEFTVDVEQGTVTRTLNNTTYSSSGISFSPPSNASVFLFGFNDGNDNIGQIATIKLYSAKIYIDNFLVRDFIPVLDYNGTPCLFDKVEAKFYYNKGTGQFIAGPVLQ